MVRMLYERVSRAGPRRRLLLKAALPLPAVGFMLAVAGAEFGMAQIDEPGTTALSRCGIPDIRQPVRCGVFHMPENPEKPAGRRLPISVVIIPASNGPALADPIVPLMGGPGEESISAAPILAELFSKLNRHRDILLVDQRGTGRSGALRCKLYSDDEAAASLRDLFPIAAVKRCFRRLSERADLTQYTYTDFARDLEQVRRALGYGPMNLWAGSYGTRAAQVYLRDYEQSVRTVYLGSVVPLDVPTPLTMAKTAQAVVESTISACEADEACGAAFPDLRRELVEILERLESGKVRVIVPGHSETAPLQRGRVVEWLRARLYRPTSASTLPWLIHRAYEGDWKPIVEGILSQAREADAAISFGLFFSITCNEDVAFMPEEDIVSETAGTFLGDYRVRQQQAACRHWPEVSLPEDYRRPVRSSVPALFVSGDTDAASPLWFTERVAAGFPNRAEIVLRGRGHTEWTDCVEQLYERFVSRGSADGLETSTCEPFPRPPFKTARGPGR